MANPNSHDHTYLIELLAEPELFDPSDMPTGREYLHSDAKFALDILLSLGVIPITGLPSLVGAAAIQLIDHVPPIFRQRRIGYGGKPFTIYKLQTMPGMPEDTHSNGRHNDERRSKLGKLLSLLRIDESPQLLNVVRREMSVVCPRPLLASYLSQVRYLVGPKESDEWIKVRSLALGGIFDEFSNLHHSYKIEGDDAEQLRQRIAIESEYILETASIGKDLRVLSDTAALFGSTAVHHGIAALKKGISSASERFESL